MAEQATRRVGRPKKAEAKPQESVEAPTASPKKKPIIKRTEVVQEHKEYEIIRNGGIVFMLPQKGITVYDKDNDTVREMRYCPNEPSIFVDEQSNNALKQSVIFRDGKLFVPKDKPNLRKFMELHPMNQANGGSVFKEVDKRKDATNQLEQEFLLNDAISKVRDADLNELLPVAMFFNVNINTPVNEIRYNLLNIAKKKPTEFLQSFDSPQVMARSTVKQAESYQIIKVKKDGVYWFDSNSLIVSVPVGQDPTDVMVRFCLTERGASVLTSLEERLERLA